MERRCLSELSENGETRIQLIGAPGAAVRERYSDCPDPACRRAPMTGDAVNAVT
jgi:hypothetical protein